METNLQWHVPPACQGQIVEVSYAIDGDAELVYRRTTDQSIGLGRPGRVTYAQADLDTMTGEWEPWNEEPAGLDWEPCRRWLTVDHAVDEVWPTSPTMTADDWFDPTDAKWWSQCQGVIDGGLDPNECAELWVARTEVQS